MGGGLNTRWVRKCLQYSHYKRLADAIVIHTSISNENKGFSTVVKKKTQVVSRPPQYKELMEPQVSRDCGGHTWRLCAIPQGTWSGCKDSANSLQGIGVGGSVPWEGAESSCSRASPSSRPPEGTVSSRGHLGTVVQR